MKSAQAPKMNTLGYALLGILARDEHSGYELSRSLKDPVAFFWHAQHSQIYPELARLETFGMVEYTLIEQSQRPDKKVYRLTQKGKDILKNWLQTPIEVPKIRDELVLKAYSIWLTDVGAAKQLIEDHALAHQKRLEDFEARLEKLQTHHPQEILQLNSHWFGVMAVLQRGIGYEREYLGWCRWLLGVFAANQPEQ